ncbi:MAG TPA: TonB family protein [Sphingomonas sp.]|jgi:protein TonB|uniref:energy transducer TonB n=1 Tax=Sphingomonas sp. TaxID=28214 RepID=UPI002ED7A998
MAYADQKQNLGVAIGSVVLVHAALGAALLSGLAVTIFEPVDPPLITKNIPIEVPPEPVEPPPPQPRTEREQPRETINTPINVPVPEIPTPSPIDLTTSTIIYPPQPPVRDVVAPPQPPVPPPSVDLARALRPRGDQGGWFPQDSYPPAARRAGAEGRVSVSVDVGTDGRVTACRVTSSSGNTDLDNATCRLATRNGRFEPARDASGAPTTSTTALRNVRWALE